MSQLHPSYLTFHKGLSEKNLSELRIGRSVQTKKNNQTKIKPNNKCVCALVWGAKLVEPKHFRAYFITSKNFNDAH